MVLLLSDNGKVLVRRDAIDLRDDPPGLVLIAVELPRAVKATALKDSKYDPLDGKEFASRKEFLKAVQAFH